MKSFLSVISYKEIVNASISSLHMSVIFLRVWIKILEKRYTNLNAFIELDHFKHFNIYSSVFEGIEENGLKISKITYFFIK